MLLFHWFLVIRVILILILLPMNYDELNIVILIGQNNILKKKLINTI